MLILLLLLSTHSTPFSTLLPCATSPGQTLSSANEHDNLDTVQLTNNLRILIRAIIGIASLVALSMFIYFVRSIRYFCDQTEEVGNTPFGFNFPIVCCSQANGGINQTNEIGTD